MYTSQVLFAFTLLLVPIFCQPSCSQDWECSSITENYNYAKCVNGKCACRSELGFSGVAITTDKCRCEGSVYWGNGLPYCKNCVSPKKIIYDNGFPYCVDPAQCELDNAVSVRDSIRRDKVRRIYELLIGQAPFFVLTEQIPVTDIFDTNVGGRVSPVGSFDSFLAVEEYFYGLALTPTQFVQSINIKSLTSTGDKVGVEVDILFNNTLFGTLQNLTQMGFYQFNSNNLVVSLDLVILNLGAAQDIPEAFRPAAISQLCAALTVSPGFCPPTADPAGAYSNFTDCVNFMNSIPFGSWNRADSNSVVCRQLHSILAALRPTVHCPHSGKTGGGKCVDHPYQSYYDKDY